MKRFIPAFALLLVAMTAFPPSTIAEDNCRTFRAIAEAQYPSPYALNAPLLDVWGGTIFASVGTPGAQSTPTALVGIFSGADADDYAVDERARKFGGMGLNGSYTFKFDYSNPPGKLEAIDRFTVTLGRAVWNVKPGEVVGDYQASGQLTSGAGRFARATGSFTVHGPFFFSFPTAIWVPEVNGTVCNVDW